MAFPFVIQNVSLLFFSMMNNDLYQSVYKMKNPLSIHTSPDLWRSCMDDAQVVMECEQRVFIEVPENIWMDVVIFPTIDFVYMKQE